MLQKFTDLTLDVIGICAFGYDFNCVIGGTSDESQASNTILSANFNIVRRSFEELIPLLKLIPSKEREDLKKAEDLFYGLIKKVWLSFPMLLYPFHFHFFDTNPRFSIRDNA